MLLFSRPMSAVPNLPVNIGDWLVDPRDDSLTRGAERVKIEPRTMRLLMRLAQTPGVVVSQDELLESVWGGVVVGTASIYQSMSQLRKVLGDTDDAPRYIETVARKGYRLLAPVSAAPPAPPRAVVEAASGSPPQAAGTASSPAGTRPFGWLALAALSGLAVMAAVWRFAPENQPAPDPASIAVLPFIDLTSGKTEQAFCDGLTEETSSWLAQIPTLRVVARTSAFAYRDRDEDVRTIGQELNISHVLKGSLRRFGDQMRITVQLIDTNNRSNIWSHSYNVEAGNVLNVQEQVARAVAGSLELRMTAETDSRFAGRRSSSAEAQRLYLIAKSHAAMGDGTSNEQAITLFRQALESDPEFALAKVWLARALVNRRYYNGQPIEELAPEIEQLLAEVAKAAPQLVDLYVVRGGFETEMRRSDAALADLKRALSMSPKSFEAASALGFYHFTAGAPRDALTYFTMASALQPREFSMHAYRCYALTDLAQYAAADADCDRARVLEPESGLVYYVLSSTQAERGRLEDAARWNQLALERGDRPTRNKADRAEWLLALGLPADAGAVYESAFAADPTGVRRNAALMYVGAASAADAGGAKGLESFIRDKGLTGDLDPMQLFQLANAALIAGEKQQGRSYVDRALDSPKLSPEELASGWRARTGRSYLLVSAGALQATGDAAAADRRLGELDALLARVGAAGVQTAGYFELRAELAAMRGQGDAAVAELRRAVEAGWCSAWTAEHEPYFDSVKGRDDFRELLAAVRARNAATAAKLRPRLVAQN